MHCAICDTDSDSVIWSNYEGNFLPCYDCQSAIAECLAEFEDETVPSVGESALSTNDARSEIECVGSLTEGR